MIMKKTGLVKPYSTKELKGIGIALILTGLLMAIFCVSVYQHGSETQLVNTKWGTEVLPETSPRSTFYLFLAACGLLISVGGVVPLIKGFQKKEK